MLLLLLDSDGYETWARMRVDGVLKVTNSGETVVRFYFHNVAWLHEGDEEGAIGVSRGRTCAIGVWVNLLSWLSRPVLPFVPLPVPLPLSYGYILLAC